MPPCWITEVLIHSFTPVQKRERERPKWMITMISLCYTGWQVCVIWDSRFKKNPPSMNQCAFFVSSGTSKIHLILNILSNKHQHPVNIQPSNIQSKIILATSFFMVWHFYSSLWWLFAFQLHKWSSLLPSGWMLSEEFEGTSWFFYCKG